MMQEECVEFVNQDGCVLRGLLHHGKTDTLKEISVISLNTGLNDMVGWHRLQVKNARILAEKGYNVLRFDDVGIGYSDGDLSQGNVLNLFVEIEKGGWVGDAIGAIDFMVSRFPQDRMVLLGYCGGGLTGFHTAAVDRRVSGIIDVGAPVTLSMEEGNRQDPWTVKENVSNLKDKLINPQSIKNFLTGKSDYGLICESIINFTKHKIRGAYSKELSEEEGTALSLNHNFFVSFKKCFQRELPVYFYYAEHDKATWGFKRYFLEEYLNGKYWSDSCCRYKEVAGANHIFSDTASQAIMQTDILGWLNELYGNELH